MEPKRYKYPRTLHFPWSEHVTTDDKIWDPGDVGCAFDGKRVVVSEKLDGENTTLYPDYIHARTTASSDHVSRHWVKSLWGTIRNDIPEGWRICGENMAAEHSIHYRNLTSYFYAFAIFDADNQCLPWDDTKEFCQMLGVQTAPVLWEGVWDEAAVKACWTNRSSFEGTYDVETGEDAQEGYVVRLADGFDYPQQSGTQRLCLKTVGKFVRRNHVRKNEFWKERFVPNEMR